MYAIGVAEQIIVAISQYGDTCCISPFQKWKGLARIGNLSKNGSLPGLVIDQNNILNVLIFNLKTTWSTKISMPFLSSLDNLILDAYIIFQKGVDYFEIENKTC